MSNSTTHLDLVSSSQAQKEVVVNAALDAASPAMLYGRRSSTSAGLTWGYYGGVVQVNGIPTQVANGTVQLNASATCYVEADLTDGTVSSNTSGFTAGRLPLYRVETGANTITSYTDLRVLGGGTSAPVKSVNEQTGDVVLDAADVGADPAGAAAAAISAHAAAADPHAQYALESTIGQAGGIAPLGGDGKVPAANLPASAQTGGTVTSVDLAVPGLLYTVSGGPVTGAGTLTFALKTQAKNTFLAGPASGADATPAMRTLTQADLPAQPFDVTAFYPGVPSASAIVTRVPVARAVTFPASLTGSIGKASVAATAQTDFDIQKNGTSVGTVRFAAGATTASFIAASAISLAGGDVLSIVGGTADATLANIGIVLAGTR